MGKKSEKRRRIGSDDEYTIQLESRVKALEDLVGGFLNSLKEKDARIAQLEAQLSQRSPDTADLNSADDATAAFPSSPIEKDTLVIGDSLADSLDPESINPNGDTTIHAVHGGTPTDIVDAFRKTFHTKTVFKRIIVHFGSNLIPKFSPDYVADNVIESLLSIKRMVGTKCRVQFSSILPKLGNHLLPAIRYMNNRIIHAGFTGPPSVQWGYVENVFTGFVTRDGVDWKHFKHDGIHLSKSGVLVFNNSIKRLFKGSK